MRMPWKPTSRFDGLEAELRSRRPEPGPDFVRSLAERVRQDPSRRRDAFRPPRLAFAAVLSAAMLAVLASVGGFGYAASAVKQAASAVESILIGAGSPDAVVVQGLSPGGDQYQPGFAFGDPSANHGGPPGLQRAGGEFAPPLVARCNDEGATARLPVRVALDEQADLAVSVLRPNGKKLPLAQPGAAGEKTQTIDYRVLIPRTLRLTLRVPCDLLDEGKRYRVQILATDPDGQSSTLRIPFRVQGGTA